MQAFSLSINLRHGIVLPLHGTGQGFECLRLHIYENGFFRGYRSGLALRHRRETRLSSLAFSGFQVFLAASVGLDFP